MTTNTLPIVRRALIGDEFRMMQHMQVPQSTIDEALRILQLIRLVWARQSTLSAITQPSDPMAGEIMADLGVQNPQEPGLGYSIDLANTSEASLQVSLSEDNSGGAFSMVLSMPVEIYDTIDTASGDNDVSGLTDAQKANYKKKKVWVVTSDPARSTGQSLPNSATVNVPPARPMTSERKQNYFGSFDTSSNRLVVSFFPRTSLAPGLYSALLTLKLTSGTETLMSGKFRVRAVVGGLVFSPAAKSVLKQNTQSAIQLTVQNPFDVPMVATVALNPNAPKGVTMLSEQRILVGSLQTKQASIELGVTTDARPAAAVQIPLTIQTGMAADNGAPIGGTREDIMVVGASVNPAPIGITMPTQFEGKQGDTISLPVQITAQGSATTVAFSLVSAPTNVTIVSGTETASVGTQSQAVHTIQLKIDELTPVSTKEVPSWSCLIEAQAYLGFVPVINLPFTLVVDKTTMFWSATDITLNKWVSVERTNLTMSSDGTWQWSYTIHDTGILRGDNYIFTFRIGDIGFDHQESLGVGETDSRSFASSSPDPIVQKNWKALFAKGPIFEGDASDKWNIVNGAQWLKDNWPQIQQILAGVQQ